MEFKDIVEYAKNLNYRIEEEEYCYKLIRLNKDKFEIRMLIPNDRIKEDLPDNVNIDWEYSIINQLDNKKIHGEWFDYYNGNSTTKIDDLQKDILKYLDNFAAKKIIIAERSLINFLGLRFLKFKELEFE